ncbi:D-Ala-D-Ala carboxypeptidase family metallohydrolase [Capnocytophaga sp.]|uniref:YcbK family protein n=1 Tax=Capnocytophaga sp. TaxID=44737 RepID=UPI0026DC6E4B|nr:D-Ala-D-Ala carboxypeptidase family metallohydrolase [Capnocytophaga sp.]MDO5106587.1 D-Ala-D-Ala carboxypeptidase family metallohydrolase [Capnocytophaga sp.]
MQLTKNFTKKEFECRDGSVMPLQVLENVKIVAEQLQILRDFVGKSIVINSGYRSPSYNKRVGGAPKSQHLLGKAADITIVGLSPKKVAQIIENLIKEGKMKQGGIGIYKGFTHYDIRGVKARWDFSNK